MELKVNIADEGILHPERFANADFSLEEMQKAIAFATEKTKENCKTFKNLFPAPASTNNVYEAIENDDWTAAFWTGLLWLSYELTGDKKFLDEAGSHLQLFEYRLKNRIGIDHDLGFLYILGTISNYRITGNDRGRTLGIEAADMLMERFLPKAGIIQAWGELGDAKESGRMIIDCLMNLPLLFWATKQTGDPKYHDAAISHLTLSCQYLFRPNATTFHTYFMDINTGKALNGVTSQGYADDSCWTRGQTWAVYGLAWAYHYTREPKLIETAKRLANYIINRLPEDNVCYWDLVFSQGDEERDSSSASIFACGLLELAKILPLADPCRNIYENAAKLMIQSLSKNYTSVNDSNSNGILLHGVYSKPEGRGVNECCIWGDYYYLEALARLTTIWDLYV